MDCKLCGTDQTNVGLCVWCKESLRVARLDAEIARLNSEIVRLKALLPTDEERAALSREADDTFTPADSVVCCGYIDRLLEGLPDADNAD